jgi:hypothetical protein
MQPLKRAFHVKKQFHGASAAYGYANMVRGKFPLEKRHREVGSQHDYRDDGIDAIGWLGNIPAVMGCGSCSHDISRLAPCECTLARASERGVGHGTYYSE